MRAFSEDEFSATAALCVRNRTRNVRAPVVLSFVTSSDARSSNSLSQPDRLSSREKLILLTLRIRPHTGPARRRALSLEGTRGCVRSRSRRSYPPRIPTTTFLREFASGLDLAALMRFISGSVGRGTGHSVQDQKVPTARCLVSEQCHYLSFRYARRGLSE